MPIASEADLRRLETQPYEKLVPWQSKAEIFEATAACYGDRPALTVLGANPLEDEAQTLSHRQLLAVIRQAANMYGALGARRQSVIAILSRTHPLIPALMWGAEIAGVASCLNYLLSPAVIASLLQAQQACVLVCPGPDLDEEIWQKVQQVLQHTSCIKHVLVLGTLPAFGRAANCQYHSVDSFLNQQDHTSWQLPSMPGRQDTAALFHTGGTTGVPKLVPQTHLNQIHAAWSLAQSFNLGPQDVALNGFPLFHVGGTSTIGMSVLATGGHIVILSPAGLRNPKVVQHIWALTERYRATFIGGVPTSIGSMSEVPVGQYDLSSVRFAFTGGASLPSTIAERFEERTGIALLEQYGMTESVAALTATPLHGRHIRGSVGLRSPFSRIRILRTQTDGQCQDCRPGEIGSVVAYGPQIVHGYLNPEHNTGSFTPDGGLVTGDLGYLDDHQYLFLTGREKDLIIRSGHNIDPTAIEEVVNAHPTVRLSAAVGMPDEYAGEVPVVFIESHPHQTPDLDELQNYIREHILEPPARPRQIFVLAAIPVTAVGKIYKPALREQALQYKLKSLLAQTAPELRFLGLSPANDKHVATLHVHSSSAQQALSGPPLRAALAQLPVKILLDWQLD